MPFIIDAPWHRQYLPKVHFKVISGDISILVVSAKENQFDAAFHKRQLKEHVLLRKVPGIANISELI